MDAQATFRAGREGWLKRMAALFSSARERRTFLINNLHHILGRYGEAALTEGPDVVRERVRVMWPPVPGALAAAVAMARAAVTAVAKPRRRFR